VIEFRTARKIARVHDPRREFALTEIESEVRYDPLTGESARICHFAYPPRAIPDLGGIVEATRAACPFCPERIERVTPRYPRELLEAGRMKRGAATLVPNLFPYDDVSAIVSMSREHFLPMDAMAPGTIADSLKLARDFITLAAGRMAGGGEAHEALYGLVTWNYMPPSGASQVHPHMQVIVTATPGNQLARELEAERRFRERAGRPYAGVLAEAERGGERWLAEADGIEWSVPFCPTGLLGDARAVFADRSTLAECADAELDAFAGFLARLLAAYARLGLWSFNMTLLPDFLGGRSGRHRLTARLLPRLYLHPQLYNSDATYLQLLLGEKFAMVYPERHAEALRAALQEAAGARP